MAITVEIYYQSHQSQVCTNLVPRAFVALVMRNGKGNEGSGKEMGSVLFSFPEAALL